MAIDPIYQRITFVDANGKLTREAIRLLEQIGTTGNTVQNISNTTVMQGQASAFDDVPQRDVTQEIINALLQTGDTPRTVDTDAAGNVDWSSPQAPADLLAGIVLADTPATIQLDPLAYAILTDTPQPVQIDPLAVLAMMDAADPGSALLLNTNTWTGTNTFNAAIKSNPAAASGFTNYFRPNSANVASTSQLNPGLLLWDGLTNRGWGVDLGYLPATGRYRARVFGDGSGDVSLSVQSTGGATAQSSFTDYLVLRGDSGNVGIATSAPNYPLDVNGACNATSYRVGGTAGVSGTITIPKLTTANGSITVTNGIITAFTNPT